VAAVAGLLACPTLELVLACLLDLGETLSREPQKPVVHKDRAAVVTLPEFDEPADLVARVAQRLQARRLLDGALEPGQLAFDQVGQSETPGPVDTVGGAHGVPAPVRSLDEPCLPSAS